MCIFISAWYVVMYQYNYTGPHLKIITYYIISLYVNSILKSLLSLQLMNSDDFVKLLKPKSL